MKVTYLIHQFYPEYYTGTEKFVFNIASMQQRAGYSVRIITYSFYDDAFYESRFQDILYKRFSYKGLPVIALRHAKIPENIHVALDDESMVGIARHLLTSEKPDIIHVGHSMRMNEFVAVSREMGIPYISTLTDFWLICPKVNLISSGGDLCAGAEEGSACKSLCPEISKDFLLKRYALARESLFNAKSVVSPSLFLMSLFKKEFNNLEVSLINHGLSYKRIVRNQKHYKEGDGLVFCYAGSFNEHKGLHLLISAFKMITSSNVVLKIYGSGPDPFYVKRILDMSRDDGRIEFCGVYSECDTGNIFANVDMVIVPSLWYENYPLVLHEALACETPVIASNIGGMAEKIKDGINGFTFQVGDREALKTVMEKVIRDPRILDELRGNMHTFLTPAIEQEAYAYHRLYRSLSQ